MIKTIVIVGSLLLGGSEVHSSYELSQHNEAYVSNYDGICVFLLRNSEGLMEYETVVSFGSCKPTTIKMIKVTLNKLPGTIYSDEEAALAKRLGLINGDPTKKSCLIKLI
jgi:hypothetical protein